MGSAQPSLNLWWETENAVRYPVSCLKHSPWNTLPLKPWGLNSTTESVVEKKLPNLCLQWDSFSQSVFQCPPSSMMVHAGWSGKLYLERAIPNTHFFFFFSRIDRSPILLISRTQPQTPMQRRWAPQLDSSLKPSCTRSSGADPPCCRNYEPRQLSSIQEEACDLGKWFASLSEF